MRWVSVIVGLLLLPGCFAWQPEWPSNQIASERREAVTLKKNADHLFSVADTRHEMLKVIDLQLQYLAAQPSDRETMVLLANQYILFGAAYSENSKEREQAYLEAMQLAARACYEHAGFRYRVNQGEPFWDAAVSLDEKHLDALGFWVTALFYWYKDCQGAMGQVINFRWMGYANKILTHMSALDPSWGNGMLSFLWGVYYLAIPEVAGGDHKRSAKYFQDAVNKGPAWLQHRWGRGRYFYTKMGDKGKCRSDLLWVISQNIEQAAGPYAWRIYIQRDAQKFLDNIDRYFP